MDNMSDDDVWVSLEAPALRDSDVPPSRHAVPASVMPPLELDTFVTVGEPGRYWILDELLVAAGPFILADGTEAYSLMPAAEHGASRHPSRLPENGPPIGGYRHVPTSSIWVYRDDTSQRTVDELEAFNANAWVHRISDSQEPPPVLRPRPAREAPTLLGRRVRVPMKTRGEWMWMVALTEPRDTGQDIAVAVTPIGDYYRFIYGSDPGQGHIFYPALHTVWIY